MPNNDKQDTTNLDAIFQNIFSAAEQSRIKNDKWIVIDSAYAHLEQLTAHNYQDVLKRIIHLIEHFPDLDYGGPGPFGMLIEKETPSAYLPPLMESLRRKPSSQVLHWLARTMRIPLPQRQSEGGVEPTAFAEVLRNVLQHPLATEDCKSFARICLLECAA